MQIISDLIKYMQINTSSENDDFFRLNILTHMAMITTNMRIGVEMPNKDIIPTNLYTLNLAVSGLGKNHSLNILEEFLIQPFKERYITFYRNIRDRNLNSYPDPAKALRLYKEQGQGYFSFDDATIPAIRQLRNKYILSGTNAITLIQDEIGDTLLGNMDLYTLFLSMYDRGIVKQKLLKHTKENEQILELQGEVPTNMLLFGTPASLLDASHKEKALFNMFEKGYARRFLFAYEDSHKLLNLPIEEQLELLNGSLKESLSLSIERRLDVLITESNHGKILGFDKEAAKALLKMRKDASEEINQISESEVIKRIELIHRYFKVAKLSGVLGFFENKNTISTEIINQAKQIVDESSKALERILSTPKPYGRLAEYLAEYKEPLTFSDIETNLPFFSGSLAKKRDMLKMAVSYGYSKNIIIKHTNKYDVDFIQGSRIEEIDINKLIISTSRNMGHNFEPHIINWEQLKILVTTSNVYYSNHQYDDKHRVKHCLLPGFNFIIFDIDDGTPIEAIQDLFLSEYKFFLYTTKSHSDKLNRYRLILPISHQLNLEYDDYKLFMTNLRSWLPFTTDVSTFDPTRMWSAFPGKTVENEGKILNILPFIPYTTEEQEYNKKLKTKKYSDNITNWFLLNTQKGNRNNNLYRYAKFLQDTGMSNREIVKKVIVLNNNLTYPISKNRLENTVLKSFK